MQSEALQMKTQKRRVNFGKYSGILILIVMIVVCSLIEELSLIHI